MAVLKVITVVFILLGSFACLIDWLGSSTRAQRLGCHFLVADGKLSGCLELDTSAEEQEQRRLGLTNLWRQKHNKANDLPLMTRPVAVAPAWAKVKGANVNLDQSDPAETTADSLDEGEDAVKQGGDWSQSHMGFSDGSFSDGGFSDGDFSVSKSSSGNSHSSINSNSGDSGNNPFQKSLALVRDAAADANIPLDVRLGRPVPMIEPPSVMALRNTHGNAAAPNHVWATRAHNRGSNGNSNGGSGSRSVNHKEKYKVHAKSSGSGGLDSSSSGGGVWISHSSSSSDVESSASDLPEEGSTSGAKHPPQTYVTSAGTETSPSSMSGDLPGAHRGYDHHKCSRRACMSTSFASRTSVVWAATLGWISPTAMIDQSTVDNSGSSSSSNSKMRNVAKEKTSGSEDGPPSVSVCASAYESPLDGQCPRHDLTWWGARDYCESVGARLCTASELRRGLGASSAPFPSSTSCGASSQRAGAHKWSSDSCEPHGKEGWFLQVEQGGLQPKSITEHQEGGSDRRVLAEWLHKNGSSRNSSNSRSGKRTNSNNSSRSSSRRVAQSLAASSPSSRRLKSAQEVMRSSNGFSDSDIIVREADLQAAVASEKKSVEAAMRGNGDRVPLPQSSLVDLLPQPRKPQDKIDRGRGKKNGRSGIGSRMGDYLNPNSNSIKINSHESSFNEDSKAPLLHDQSIGDEWTHGEDLQDNAIGLGHREDGFTQQALQAAAQVKAQRAKEARLEAKKEAMWQQKEAQKQEQEKKKGQRSGTSQGGGNSNNKGIPINADAERGFTGNFGLTRCLPANQEAEASPVCCADVRPAVCATNNDNNDGGSRTNTETIDQEQVLEEAEQLLRANEQSSKPRERIAVLLFGESARETNPHGKRRSPQGERCSTRGRAQQLVAIESQKLKFFAVLKALGYAVDVFLATNDCPQVLIDSAAQPSTSTTSKDKGAPSELPESVWGSALRRVYAPWLRGISIDDCSAYPNQRCHLHRALALLAQHVGMPDFIHGARGSGSSHTGGSSNAGKGSPSRNRGRNKDGESKSSSSGSNNHAWMSGGEYEPAQSLNPLIAAAKTAAMKARQQGQHTQLQAQRQRQLSLSLHNSTAQQKLMQRQPQQQQKEHGTLHRRHLLSNAWEWADRGPSKYDTDNIGAHSSLSSSTSFSSSGWDASSDSISGMIEWSVSQGAGKPLNYFQSSGKSGGGAKGGKRGGWSKPYHEQSGLRGGEKFGWDRNNGDSHLSPLSIVEGNVNRVGRNDGVSSSWDASEWLAHVKPSGANHDEAFTMTAVSEEGVEVSRNNAKERDGKSGANGKYDEKAAGHNEDVDGAAQKDERLETAKKTEPSPVWMSESEKLAARKESRIEAKRAHLSATARAQLHVWATARAAQANNDNNDNDNHNEHIRTSSFSSGRSEEFPYAFVLMSRPDLVLGKQGAELVRDMVTTPAQGSKNEKRNTFSWPHRCEPSAWTQWRCVADTLVAIPGNFFRAYYAQCLGKVGCHADAYGDSQKVRFDAVDRGGILPYSGHSCYRCVASMAATALSTTTTGASSTMDSTETSADSSSAWLAFQKPAVMNDTSFAHSQDLRCFGDAIFLRDLPRCAYLCHSAPHNRCVGWTIAPPPSPTTCCLKSWVSGEVHYAPNVVSGVEGLPKDVHLRLKGAQVGLARHESRLVNARVESGKNPYYRFADSVHLEDV